MYTERYVTQTAGGGGIGTEGDPWTLAEAFANAVAGDRVNVLSDAGYSIAGGTISGAGSYNSRVVFRGYNSTIGDLEGQGRNSDGSLNVTSFPVITTTGSIIPSAYSILQNLYFTGAIAATVLNGASPDQTVAISCKAENTLSSASARAGEGDNNSGFINCDFVCTQTTHGVIFSADVNSNVIGCRFVGASSSQTWCSIRDGSVISCAFVNTGTSGTSIGLNLELTGQQIVLYNTFYNFGTDIQTPNAAGATATFFYINNHYTDSSKGLDNLYAATAAHFIIEMNSRTRDNTTPRTGYGDSLNIAEVTTDTGGASTDYVDAPNGDINLITGAPGIDSGVGIGSWDIGAYQNAESGGSGGLLQANKRGNKQ